MSNEEELEEVVTKLAKCLSEITKDGNGPAVVQAMVFLCREIFLRHKEESAFLNDKVSEARFRKVVDLFDQINEVMLSEQEPRESEIERMINEKK